MSPDEIQQALETLKTIVAPAVVASLLVMLAVRLVGGEKIAPLAAALAVAAGLFAGNHFRGLLSDISSNQIPSVQNLRAILAQSIEREIRDVPEGQSRLHVPQRHFWIPGLVGLAMLVELIVGRSFIPASLAWILRAFVAILAARMLTSETLRLHTPEAPWLLGGAMLLLWSVMTELVRLWKDGVAGTVMVLCLGAATLALKQQAIGPSLAEMMVLCFAAFLGPVIVTWKLPGDTSPVVAAAAIVLPSLLFLGHQSSDPPYPLRNFLLIGLAPLSLTPMLLPKFLSATGLKRWLPGLVLPLIPVALAIYWILKETPLAAGSMGH